MIRVLVIAFVLLSSGTVMAQDKPAMPIKVIFSESPLVKGTFVVQFRNRGQTSFFLHAKFERADDSVHKMFGLVMPDNLIREVGDKQGWDLKSGDIISLTSQGYRDLQVHMP